MSEPDIGSEFAGNRVPTASSVPTCLAFDVITGFTAPAAELCTLPVEVNKEDDAMVGVDISKRSLNAFEKEYVELAAPCPFPWRDFDMLGRLDTGWDACKDGVMAAGEALVTARSKGLLPRSRTLGVLFGTVGTKDPVPRFCKSSTMEIERPVADPREDELSCRTAIDGGVASVRNASPSDTASDSDFEREVGFELD